MTRHRIGKAALWSTAGFLLGAATLAGGDTEEERREKLIEIERLCGELRALDSERVEVPVVNEQGLELDRVHLLDIVAGVPEYVRPHWAGGEEYGVFSGVLEEAPQPFGTIEEIVEIVRCNVRPDAWEAYSQITCTGSSLFLIAPPAVSRAVHAFVDKELRPPARRTVHLQLEVVEADGPLGATVAAAAGGELDAALRTEIEEAVGSGSARMLFRGCLRALSRQQVVLWHGTQAAVVSEADVEANIRADASDPLIDVEALGTIVQVRSTVGDDPGRVRVQMEIDQEALDQPIRIVKTEKVGNLQMPARTTTPVAADLWIANDRWAVAAAFAHRGGKRCTILVRPTVIGGGR